VNVALSAPLTGPGGNTIPDKNITIYREDYYNVVTPSDQEGAPGLWPDALIPARDPWFGQSRNAFPIDVPADENRVAWVDVLVPQNATPGAYSGSMKVTAADFDATVPIQLAVFNATLPSTSSLSSAFGMGFQDACLAQYGGAESCPTPDEGYRLNALLMRVALDNRITISGPHYQPPVSGNIPPFRQHTLPLLNGTAPTRLAGARLTSLQVDKGTHLAAWRDEARNSGFADRAFVYACDEPGGDSLRWDKCEDEAFRARQVWPDVPILVTASIQDADRFGATGHINRLTALVNYMDNKPNQPYAGNQRSSYDAFLGEPDNQVWLYTSCFSHGCEPNHAIENDCRTSTDSGATNDPYFDGWPGYVIDKPASEARAMGWISFLYRTSGELYFTTLQDQKRKTA
jgi:hypothetical protein